MKATFTLTVLLTAAASILAARQTSFPKNSISGNYLEVRTCDVYTGYCVANAEMGVSGKEGMLVWTVREGTWNGVSLRDLSVIAVLRAAGTLGDQRYQPQSGQAVLIVDAKATVKQKQALEDMARSLAGALIKEVVSVKSSPIDSSVGTCAKSGCAAVKAGDLLEISTRCFTDRDHLCGNEATYYPPLTEVDHAVPAFTEIASYQGAGLNLTWEATHQRSAFIAQFSR